MPCVTSSMSLAGALLIFGIQASATWLEDKTWEQYVRSPSHPVMHPATILAENTTGNVSNPEGLITGNGVTQLTRSEGDSDAPAIVIDFGQNVVGILSIDFAGASNTTEGFPGLKLAFSETMEYLTNRSDFTRSDNAAGDEKLTNGTDQIAVKGDPYVWEDKLGCEYGTQVCSDGLHGFRYLRIWLEALESDAPHTSSLGTVAISSLSLEWSAYLGTPDTYTGWFECSDEDLTQWWFDGVYTVDLGTDVFLANETEPRQADSPTLEGKQVLFDGAKRDRDPYVGDLAVASLTSYLSHDFSESTRNVLEDLVLHQREDGWIPPASINNYTLPLFDYPLWWVVCSVDLVLYTGNISYAETYWDALAKVLDEYYPAYMSDENLLVKADELGYGDYAFLPRSGPVTYYNALYVHALKYAAQLAKSIRNHDDADRWTSRASDVADAVLGSNFDPSVGAFYDGGPCPDEAAGTYCDVHAQDGNSIAVLAGITNSTTSNQILDYWANATAHPYGNAFYDSSILSPGDSFDQRVYAFISYFELAARLATPGAADSAFEEIRRLYGWMSTHDPKITMWEGIGPNGGTYSEGFTSMAHGWSTGIVSLMSNYVLGVTPLEPGFSRWRVFPVVDGGDLTWARGVVPTPNGRIGVSWERQEGDGGSMLHLEVVVPDGTKGTISVRTAGFASAKVTLDDKEITHDGQQVDIDVVGGSHTVIVGA